LASAKRLADVVKSTKKEGLAHQVVALIGRLYLLERELKDKDASPALIFMHRSKKARPVLAQIKAILDDAQLKVPPKSPLGAAFFYTLTHWEALNTYLYDGRLEIDNNRSERTIKPFVIGRKNWLFHGNDIGANAGSILFSLIETCKQNHIEVFSWLKYVLATIHQADTIEKLEKLLPYHIDPQLLNNMRSLPNLIMPE
jgi:transposase